MADPRDPTTALELPTGAVQGPRTRADVDLATRLQTALGDGRTVTIADAAARSGLALADAERGLHRLGRRFGGHIAVTERGELEFRFPEGFAIDHERRDARQVAVARVVRGATAVATWTARLALTVFLVGYSVVFALGLLIGSVVLAMITEDGAPMEGAGLLLYGLVDVLFEGIYWSTHPSIANDPEARALRDARSNSHLYEQINRAFFGAPIPREDPLANRRWLTQEIRARQGRIGRSDVERVTGCTPAEAEALLTSMLVDFDGRVEVSEDGAILYVFTALRPTAALAEREAPVHPAWLFCRPIPQYTGNPDGATFRIALLWAFVTAVAAGCVALDLPWYLAELPLFTALGLAAVPILRVPGHRRRVRAALADNGHRAVLGLVHASARGGQVLRMQEAVEAWHTATGRRPNEADLQRRLIELGGDLEIAQDGSTGWRFAELEREQRALATAREQVDDDERATGAVVFRTDE
jgi:hypothetical protein